MKSFKEIYEANKTPSWDIKSNKWVNASPSYIKVQDEVTQILIDSNIKNKSDALMTIEEYNLGNRDFDIVNGNKIILKWDENE